MMKSLPSAAAVPSTKLALPIVPVDPNQAPKLDPKLLTDPAEQEVARALAQVEPEIAAALESADFEAAVEAGAELGPVLHRFFEDVLVMHENPAIRQNRLRLLLEVRDTLGALGDLAEIPR